jgi:hypothetical protein
MNNVIQYACNKVRSEIYVINANMAETVCSLKYVVLTTLGLLKTRFNANMAETVSSNMWLLQLSAH